jgi:hypothetical protein
MMTTDDGRPTMDLGRRRFDPTLRLCCTAPRCHRLTVTSNCPTGSAIIRRTPLLHHQATCLGMPYGLITAQRATGILHAQFCILHYVPFVSPKRCGVSFEQRLPVYMA